LECTPEGTAGTFSHFVVPPADTIDCPVFIVGAPRAGTTLLFEILSQCANVWTIGGESHEIIERRRRIPGPLGNRLQALHAHPATRSVVIASFLSVLRDREQTLYVELGPSDRPRRVRLLEKTPKNSLRIPFLRAVFPNSRFIFIYREPKGNIGSLVDGWLAPNRFNSYRIGDMQWKFLLPPNWERLRKKNIVEISAAQWKSANEFILNDLAEIPIADWCFLEYDCLVMEPEREIRRVCQFLSFEFDRRTKDYFVGNLPPSRSTLTPYQPRKWERHQPALATLLPSLDHVQKRIEKIRSTRSNN
jgi:hypothetical protein